MPTLLAIESSCDETSAAVIRDEQILSNLISAQVEHSEYGGVIPELASRLHQQQIVRVVQQALKQSGISPQELDGVAFTRGPGLLGALLVGTCFAKSYAYALDIPLVEVNHMHAHVLANFLMEDPPEFPFLCLTVSGGHTQIVWVKDYLEMELIGRTIDDAAGEAFDKAAKLMSLPYPGGPEIDTLAKEGNPEAFSFPTPKLQGLDFSFSGIKTSLLYQLRDGLKTNPDFIQDNLRDIAASYQRHIVTVLLKRLKKAADKYSVKHIAIAGGVSANSELRQSFQAMCDQHDWQAHIPPFEYCTDNAAMIAIAGHYRYQAGQFADLNTTPFVREGEG